MDCMWVIVGDEEEKQLFGHILNYYRLMVPIVEASLDSMPTELNKEQQALVYLTEAVPHNAASLLCEAALKYNVMVIAYQRPELVLGITSLEDPKAIAWSQVQSKFGLILFRTFLANCFHNVVTQCNEQEEDYLDPLETEETDQSL